MLGSGEAILRSSGGFLGYLGRNRWNLNDQQDEVCPASSYTIFHASLSNFIFNFHNGCMFAFLSTLPEHSLFPTSLSIFVVSCVFGFTHSDR